ncbi:DUF2163 domain-containing protein [Candidatus Trichorickettsia mobilis]|uniref:DUF2163 domain-containing protein n=1 Tax=Candidatus Trichorickettsia mobilis TaxID=1346319 RepID=UPI00292E9ED2|nr:phage BR0599 family protein [Candidatus Trichorickettsia mobilis]
MRDLPEQIQQKITAGENFVYCFEITLSTGQNLYLTSASIAINLQNQIFLPNSGITVISGEFNDSAYNNIILDGIFEVNGIISTMDLTTATVKIILYFSGYSYHWLTYYCSVYTKFDLGFRLYLEPESKKYQQSLLQKFSKTCRTNFGDKRCKADKQLYSHCYNISEVIGNILIVVDLNKENGYFDDGELVFKETQFIAKILKQLDNNLELDQAIPDVLKEHKEVILIAGCDKKFITCCNKFNNAVNFRGEPWIPEDNFLSVNE